MNGYDAGKAMMKLMIVLYLLHKLLPIASEYMPTMVYFAVFLATALMTLYTALNSRLSYWIVIALLLFAPSVFDAYDLMQHASMTNTAKFLYGEAQIYIQIVIALIYIKLMNGREKKRMLRFLFLAYLLTAFCTAAACIQTPNVARIITGDSGGAAYHLYRRNNVGDFVFAYEFILLTPLLICCIKNRRLNRAGGLMLLVFCGLAVLEMQFTLGLMLFVVFASTLFLPRLKRKHVWWIVLGAGFVFLFARPFLADLFDSLGKQVDNRSFASRFEYIAVVLRGEQIPKALESDAGARFDLYMLSFREFLSDPLGHWGKGVTGGHSYILDRAAKYGLAGLMAIAAMYVAMYSIFLKPYRESSCYPYLLLGFLASIVMATINTKTFMFIFVCVYPLFAQVYTESEKSAAYHPFYQRSIQER